MQCSARSKAELGLPIMYPVPPETLGCGRCRDCIQRQSCHTAGLEGNLGCACWAVEAQGESPKPTGAARDGSLEGGHVESGF